MFMVFRLLSLRYVLKKWDRAALIVASIALGVATLVSTRILNQVIQEAAANTTTPLGLGDLFISNGENGVDRKTGGRDPCGEDTRHRECATGCR